MAKYKEIDVAKLKRLFDYNFRTGEITSVTTSRLVSHQLDEANRLKIKVDNYFVKIPVIELAYALHTNDFCLERLIPKDLDYSNIKANNFLVLSEQDYKKLQWLLTNLRKHCKVLPNALNVHKASVKLYTWERTMKTIKFDSYESACKYVRRIKLKLYRQLEQLGIDVNSKFLY